MAFILPSGQHFGNVGQKWASDAFTICETQYPPSTVNPVHGNEQALLVLVESGGYLKTVAKREVTCSKDDLLFIPACSLQADKFGSKQTRCLLVDFYPSFFGRLQGTTVPDVVSFPRAQFAGTRAQLLHEFKNPDSVSPLIFESLFLGMFGHASRLHRSGYGPRVPAWLCKAKELLHDCFAQPTTLDSIAQAVGVHPVHFCREFRRFYKLTPGDYLRKIRVEFAAKQLADTTMPLSQIALESGFADQAHFSRTFRRMTQQTPLEFRHSARNYRS